MTRPDILYGLEIPYDKPVEELVQLTKDKPPSCWNAYTALAYNTSDRAIDALDSMLTNPDWTHVRSAIEAIGKNSNGLKLENKLIDLLGNSNKFIVTAAIKALSNLKSQKAHDKIKALILFENLEIRQAAIEGLSNIWQLSDFDFLLDLGKHITNDTITKTIGFVLVEHVDKSNWKSFFNNYSKDTITRHREWSLCFANEFSSDRTLIEPFILDKDGHIRKKAKQFMETTKSA
jgi:hypothetical protein